LQAEFHADAPRRLLVVEDDRKLASTLKRGLDREGYGVDLASDGNEALALSSTTQYDAVVLDVLLPGRDGRSVCQALRERDKWLPVLMLTALGDVEDRVRGLDVGADDYLVKPFDFAELLARLRALLRRGPSQRPLTIEQGDLHLDPHTRTLTRAGSRSVLTQREYDVLEYMLLRPGEVISREQLLKAVWAENYDGSPNVVDVYIGYLRRKLDRPNRPDALKNVRGQGFVLDPE
jgi:DNA-binding response OmpR family regulator